MPTLPGVSTQPFDSRTIVPQGSVVGGAGIAAEAASRALLQVSGELASMEQQRVRAEMANAEATARSEYTMGLAELRQTLNEGDPATIRDRWQAGRQALQERVSQLVPERHRERIGRTLTDMDAREFSNVLGVEARRTGDVARANLLSGLDRLSTFAAGTPDPTDRATFVGEIEAQIRTAVDGGFIGAEAGERLRQNTLRRIEREAARAMVQSRRGAGPRVVRDGSLPIPPLPPEDMAALEQQAVEDVGAVGLEAEAEEAAFVAGRDAEVQETMARAIAGTDPPPPEALTDIRHEVPPARLAAAQVVAGGHAATRDDPEVVNDLTPGAGLDDDYEENLDRQVAERRITPATRERLLTTHRALSADTPEARTRRDERQQIVQALIDLPQVEGGGTFAGTFTGIGTRYLDQWDAWQAANPNLSPVERRDQLHAVINAARADTVQAAMRSLPRPGGITFPQTEPPKIADLDKLDDELLDAYDALQATNDPGEAALVAGIADELALIARWRVVAGMHEEARAAQPATGARR